MGHTACPVPAPGRSLQSEDLALHPGRTCSDPWLCPAALGGRDSPYRDKILPFSRSLSQTEAIPATSQPDNQPAPAGGAAGSSWQAGGCFPKGDFQKSSLEVDWMQGLLPLLVRTEPDSCQCVTKWVQMAPACSALPQHLGPTQGNSLGVLEVTRQLFCWRFPFLQRSCWMLSGCCMGLEYCSTCG